MSKIGRNDPCPCGSGKKYKKCCLALEQSVSAKGSRGEDSFPEPSDLYGRVDRLLQRLEEGEGTRVEPEIANLLEQHPNHAMTNYAMGVYYSVVAKAPAKAIPFFERAVAIWPDFAEAQFNLGNAARRTVDLPKAIAAFRAAAQCTDDEGIAEMARKELQWLEQTLLKGTPFASMDAYLANTRLFDQAFGCLERHEFGKAAKLFERLLAGNPGHVQSHGNLALAYASLGRRADALESIERALELDPTYEPAIANRRTILQMREGESMAVDIRSVDYYLDRARGTP